MPRIREYDSQVAAQGSIGGSSGRRADALDFGADFTVIGDSMQKVGAMLQEKAETEELTKVQVDLARAREEWTKNVAERELRATPGDTSYVASLQTDMRSYFEQMSQNYKSDKAKKYFATHAASMGAQFTGQAVGFQANLASRGAVQAAAETSDTNAKTIAADPNQYGAIVAQEEATIKGGVGIYGRIDQVQRQTLLNKNKERYAWVAETSRAEKDPEGWLRQNSPQVLERNKWTASGGGFNSVMPFIFKEEGGYAAKDGKSGAPVNFGINQAANPDIDVKNLTKEQAAKIYRERYWNPIGGDNLPPAMALVAMDTAVNMGVGTAKRLMEESGGDPLKMIALRRERYAMLAQDTGLRKYASVWAGRMNRLEAEVRGQAEAPAPAGLPATASQSYRDLDPERQLQLQNHALTRYTQLMTVERAGLERQLKDAEALISLGKDPGEIPAAKFERAYGAEGARRYTEYQEARAIVPWAQNLHGKSGAEIQALLVQEKDAIGGEGAAGDLGRLQTKTRIAESVLKARSETPVEYVVEHSPYAKDALAGMMKVLSNPQEPESRRQLATAAYADAVRLEQRRLGMPESIVSSAIAASILERMGKAKGQDVAAFMRSEAAAWGREWPTVVREMGKQMPSYAIVLGQAPNIDSDAQAILSEAAKMKEGEWKAGIEKDRLTALDQKLNKEMAQFGQMLGLQEGGQQTFAAWRAQAETLAVGYMHQGMNETEASKKAVEKLVTNVWDLKGTYRVPKSASKAVPLADIERGANVLLRDPTKLPLAIPPAPEGVREEDWRRINSARIGNDVFWSNMPGDKGVVLYKKIAPGEYAAVPSATGGNIEYTWEQLASEARNYTRTTGRTPAAQRSMMGNTGVGFD